MFDVASARRRTARASGGLALIRIYPERIVSWGLGGDRNARTVAW